MSALTKVFVVLHVILSLLLVAGLVVFVNKVEDFNQTALIAKAETNTERSAKEAALAQVAAIKGESDRAIHAAEVRATANEQRNNELLAQIAEKENQVQQAKLAADKAAVDLSNAVLAMKAAQNAYEVAEKNIVDLRNTSDALQKKYAEAMVSISDTTNKLDVMNARYRRLQEENADLQQQLASINTSGKASPFGANGQPVAVQANAGEYANIKGVVRATKEIQGVKYATISVGSADKVTKGMEFKVLDPNATKFMGYLKVDNVDYKESIGHLTGPDVSGIQAGDRVLTQLE